MSTIQQLKKRWTDFYNLDGKTDFRILSYWDKGIPERPMLWYSLKKERVEWAKRAWECEMEAAKYIDDDFMPSLSVTSGTEIFGQAMGCKVYYPEDNNPFALPFVHTPEDVSKLKVPHVLDTPLANLLEMARELKEFGGKDAVLRLPDIQSPLDIASTVWDKNSLYMAFLDEPEAVEELIEKCKTLLMEFLDMWFKEFGPEFMAHYPDYYMPYGLTLSEDEVGVINQDMFREFGVPSLEEFAHHYGRLGIHCCANSQHQWEVFSEIPNLVLLNLNRPLDIALKGSEYFKEKCCMYTVPSGDEGNIVSMPGSYKKGTHAVLYFGSETKEKAKENLHLVQDEIQRLKDNGTL